jgi:hypothetical protein
MKMRRWLLRTSPTDGSWWDRFKEAVRSLPDTSQIQTEVTLSLPDGSPLDVNKMLKENTRLLEQNQRLRHEQSVLLRQLRDVKHHESLMAGRIEAFRKKWPAIHKDFFARERKAK